MNAKPCFWKAMAEGWGGDLWKEQNGLLGEKKNPPKACKADFGGWRIGLSLGKKKPPKAREEDLHGDRSVVSGKKERGDLGKVSLRCGKCSTLRWLAQHAASAIAPHCVSRLTLLLLVPRRHRLLRQAPLSSPASAPDTIGRGCKEEAPSCSFPVRKVQEGALLYPVTLHSSAHLSLRKGAAWSGHSV